MSINKRTGQDRILAQNIIHKAVQINRNITYRIANIKTALRSLRSSGTYIHTYIHTLFIPEADDNYYIQIKLKRKYF